MVEGNGFENRRKETYQGFESLLLRYRENMTAEAQGGKHEEIWVDVSLGLAH